MKDSMPTIAVGKITQEENKCTQYIYNSISNS